MARSLARSGRSGEVGPAGYADPAMSRASDVVSSSLATALRFGVGLSARPAARRPEKPLELYEFEACPFCRRVREALSKFDLDAMVYPCPRDGTRFRPKAIEASGKSRFPFLVDPNTGKSMLESADIVAYLRETYGAPSDPVWLGPLGMVTSGMASGVRASHGRRARPSKAPGQPLELWSFEGSPYCRLVRETLCELELPYVLHNVAKGSPRREAFVKRSGKMMVPYLVDPNTGREMFESAAIVRYLGATYAA
jgi:glutathione S-transferase